VSCPGSCSFKFFLSNAFTTTYYSTMVFEGQFEDKVIALTGAASGMGLATAILLAERGAKLSLADVQAEALQKAKADIISKYPTAQVLAVVVDVRDFSQVENWIKETKRHYGQLHGAANLAGVISKSINTGELEHQDLDEWKFLIDVNLTGIMHCLKAELSALADGGSIVNAASIASLQGRAKNGAYAASKHGVLGLTRSAAKEVGVRGIRVTCFCP
jgi:NAD(P)-dependent dehydrogenase (short-subunit alcohol dehydrogenase family)